MQESNMSPMVVNPRIYRVGQSVGLREDGLPAVMAGHLIRRTLQDVAGHMGLPAGMTGRPLRGKEALCGRLFAPLLRRLIP